MLMAFVGLAAWLGPVAVADAAAPAGLTQLGGAAGCLVQPTRDALEFEDLDVRGCTRTRGTIEASSLVLSPDGRDVYVAAPGSGAVASFRRDQDTGALTQTGCASYDGTSGYDGTEGSCVDGDALTGANSVAVTPDGAYVYAASYVSGGIAIFKRDPATGQLRQSGCVRTISTCMRVNALGGAIALAVSPDGRHLYVVAEGADAVSVFERNKTNGSVRQLQCISDDGTDRLCENGNGLRGADAVIASADGRHVYVAAGDANAVLTFARDRTTGKLRQMGCAMDSAPRRGSCTRVRALEYPVGLTLTRDGRTLFAAAYYSEAVSVFERNPRTGALRQLGCLVNVYTDDEEPPSYGCAPALALESPTAVAVSRDGGDVYVAVESGLTVFSRDRVTGGLAPAGCLVARDYWDDDLRQRCGEAQALGGSSGVALGPDGAHVYLTSWDTGGIAVFGRSVVLAARLERRTRELAVRLACPKLHPTPCAGVVTLRRSHGAAPLPGARRYALAPGQRAVVRIRMTKPTLALARRPGGLPLIVAATDASRGLAPSSGRLVLRLPPHRQRAPSGPAARRTIRMTRLP
jgi:6-phosphogluconolactonase (cycloisomerase 2 family)